MNNDIDDVFLGDGALTAEQIEQARRNVESFARDDEERSMFLAMLGLQP